MAYNQATYIPGGNDDFYLPEVISPAPKRVMPEVPGNIQENLAHIELDAGPVWNRLSGLQSPPPAAEMQGSPAPSFPSRNSSLSTLANWQAHKGGLTQNGHGGKENDGTMDRPRFSPFPALKIRSPNIPPSDEDREAILEKAREPVLNSNDPEMQLTWAQDALAYMEIAMQNEMRTSSRVGSRPQTPQTEHQLRVDAVNVVSFLADQQHPKAVFIRGMWLEFGKFDFRMDRKEAYHCFSRAAQKGYARAEYRIGMQFENSNDPEKAIKHYNLGVQAQDSASSYRMGMMRLLGQHGQPLNYERGVQLIKFAAETADENAPQGAYVYGMLQARELPQVELPETCLPFDLGTARYNIEKAAYLGFAKAQTKMGAAYELCQLGCDFEPALSLHYNALAARQGEPEADMAISKWFLCGYEGLFEKSEELAFTYAQRAAQTGLATAEFAMGYFFEIGIYVSADLKEAKSWYEKASEHGNRDAAGRIDGIARANTLSKKDHHGTAIAKIQSQYGSHRGKRPDRFKTPIAPMPTISDTGADMPDSSQYTKRTGTPQRRPPSVAPYPDDDVALQPRPPYAPTNPSPDVRPNPNGPSRSGLDPNYKVPSSTSIGPPRPYSHMENVDAGRGRGAPATIVPSSLGPQGYRQPTSGPIAPHKSFAGSESARPQSAGISIGYSAPLDPTGPDGRKRIQKRGPPSGAATTSNLRPLPNHSNSTALPDRTTGQRLSSLPHSQTFANDGRTPNGKPVSHGTPSSSAPGPRPSTAVQTPGTPSVRPNTGPLPPPKFPSNDRPTATPPPSTAVSKPPGKGPKTFEEMGVPQSKKEGDCRSKSSFRASPVIYGDGLTRTLLHSRPYSATEVSSNLHNKVTKTYAAKALKELSEQQVIASKASGKQFVYHAIQDSKDAASLEDLANMDKEITSLRESIALSKSNEKLLKAGLAAVNATFSTEDLRVSITDLELQETELLARLGPLRSGSVKPVLPEEKEETEKTWRQWSRKAVSRKRICMDMWSYATEELPEGQTKQELWEELGMEEDE